MKTEVNQTPATSLNPMLSVSKYGTVLYSNEASEPLLHEWGVKVRDKLPPSIVDIVQRVVSRNSPEKIEVKAGNKVYFVVFHPLPGNKCVNISGFDISDQKEEKRKFLDSETLERSKVELTETINISLIKSLMDDFHELFNISVGLIDLKGNVMINVGWQDICVNFHRIHSDSFKHCVDSETKLTEDILPGEIKPCRCKNNMWHIATPIMIGNQQVGYICAGQFLFDDEPLDYELFRSQARKYGFNEDEYIAALEKVPLVNRKNINICISFLAKLANMISQLSYSNIKQAKSLSERDTLLEALRESEEKYRNLIETANEGILILNAEATITYVNEKIVEMLECTQDAIIGKSVSDFTDEDGKTIFEQNMKKRRHGIDEIHEFKFISKDGSPLWTLVNSKSLFDERNKFIGSMSMLTDITKRKKAEDMLAFERSQLLSIFDGIDDVVYVTDPYTYEVLYANKTMKEKFGGELVGGVCYREFQQRDSPCDFCTNPIILKERDKPYYWEYYNPTVDRYFMVMDRIIKWPDDRNVRLGIAKDITERKRAEEALRKVRATLEEKVKERTTELEKAYNSLKQSEKSLAEAQKISHLGSWDWDITTGEIWWSDELYRIFGLDPQKLASEYKEFFNLCAS